MAAERIALADLNTMETAACETSLRQCCGSTEWARRLSRARPFANVAVLLEASDRIWNDLSPDDWLEAFRSHPRIGQKKAAAAATARERSWSSAEQSGMDDAGDAVRSELSRMNDEYERRFGYIFLINATGKSPEQMLAALRERLGNPPESELRIAAGELAAITRLRLLKLLQNDR